MTNKYVDKIECQSCAYYDGIYLNEGNCRRRAPTKEGFPIVQPTSWCGEFEASDDAKQNYFALKAHEAWENSVRGVLNE